MADERLSFNHSPKTKPIDTIIYEIQMWRRSHAAIAPKREVLAKTKSDDDLYEYNLRIEGFLLHTRNLLAFFADEHCFPTDLRISKPKGWTEREEDVEQQVWQSFIDRAKKVDSDHRDKGKSCYDEISKHLSHCTRLRHSSFKDWNTDALLTDLNPIFCDFEARFVTGPPPQSEFASMALGSESNHTTQFSTFRVL